MTALVAAISIFRDMAPDTVGFQPHWLYVVLCVVCPAVLGVVTATVITLITTLKGRGKNEGGRDV